MSSSRCCRGRVAQHPADVADGGTEPRVVPRPEGGDARQHRSAARFLERLDDADPDPRPPAGGEAVDRVIVAAGGEALRQRRQRFLGQVEDLAVVDEALGRARGIDEHGDREVALLLARLQVDLVGAVAAGGQIAARSDQRIHVELCAVDLPARDLAPRPQRLELPADRADAATRRRRPVATSAAPPAPSATRSRTRQWSGR